MSQSKNPYSRRMKMPALPEGLTWVNTDRPLKLEELKGKFVLIDFWTYCCINCMHILPELKKLEHAYPNELVVIGVHSPKFDTEEDTDNLTEAVLRYKIEHPVVNDTGHVIWRRFGVRAWPTLLLIDPEGYAVWGKSGEATFEQIDEAIKLGLPYYDGRKLLDRTPMRFAREKAPETDSPLRFPGKVLADGASGRLFIADTNHNRVVVTDLEGKLLEVVGSGATGRDDGDFATARFNQPQGMALDGQILYVADTENHLLRKVDFATRT
ncbi:MAG: redoxin domain-containing protein, partial [Planctomycetes bacterium]|nr:redoxin domain-containing protein [Planctomycetota bacterium]